MKKENLDLAIYQLENWQIEVNFDKSEETFWLNQRQIAEIFWIDRTVITKHIKKIFKDSELDEKVVSAFFAHTTSHWAMEGKTQTKKVKFYNLDVILAVWYKTNSKKAIVFRKWATSILKQHITEGFTINKNRITKNYQNFLQAVEDLKKLTNWKNIWNDEVLNLIKSFANTWFNLENFDKWNLPKKWFTKDDIKLETKELYKDIEILKKDLIQKWLATEMFAQEKNKWNLEWIFGNIFASFLWEDLYETIEEKASNLLYFVIKNHPFNDGNKRTWAFCFVWFLQKYNYDFQEIISPETLTILTLLIANSVPKEKDRMVWLILLILKK